MEQLLITPDYQAQNAQLHRERDDYGASGHRFALFVQELVSANGYKTILDYGCGKETLGKTLPHLNIIGYDPAIEGRGIACSSDFVVCTDVLEHVEPDCIDAVIQHLFDVTGKKLFFCIAIRKSSKHLVDGRNAHLLIRPSTWWRQKLDQKFHVTAWEDDGQEIIGEASPLLAIQEITAIAAVTDEERNKQVKANCKRIVERVTQKGSLGQLPRHDRTAILVCFGPSLKQTWPQVKLSQFAPQTDVFTVSAAHKFMIERGIVPYAHIDCDPREHKGIQIGEPHKDVKYWLASCVHSSYLDKLEGHDVALWHSFNGEESMVALHYDKGHRMVMGGGSVGLRAISLLYYLGYRKFEIHGMDCSHEAGQIYAGEHLGKEKPSVQIKCGERWFESSAIFITYARYFDKQVTLLSDATFTLHGDGMLQEIQRLNMRDLQAAA